MKRQTIVVLSSILLLTIFASAAYLYKNQIADQIASAAKDDSSIFIREHSQTAGNVDAKVTIVEFMDPACGTCRSFYPIIKKILATEPDRLNLVIRYAPLHQGSDFIVKMLEASKEQGKYWETLETMLRYQSKWAIHHKAEPDLLWPILEKTGINIIQMKKDMLSPEISKRIAQDITDAKLLKVTKTPEFFVNGRPLPSFGLEQLKNLIKEEIAENYSN